MLGFLLSAHLRQISVGKLPRILFWNWRQYPPSQHHPWNNIILGTTLCRKQGVPSGESRQGGALASVLQTLQTSAMAEPMTTIAASIFALMLTHCMSDSNGFDVASFLQRALLIAHRPGSWPRPATFTTAARTCFYVCWFSLAFYFC